MVAMEHQVLINTGSAISNRSSGWCCMCEFKVVSARNGDCTVHKAGSVHYFLEVPFILGEVKIPHSRMTRNIGDLFVKRM